MKRKRHRTLDLLAGLGTRRCLRCDWRGPLSKTKLRLDPGEPLPVHVCPKCRSSFLVRT